MTTDTTLIQWKKYPSVNSMNQQGYTVELTIIDKDTKRPIELSCFCNQQNDDDIRNCVQQAFGVELEKHPTSN